MSRLPLRVYHRPDVAHGWIQRVQGQRPGLALVLGFTETGLIPGISAAGSTPAQRRHTALADAEFLVWGPSATPKFSLPPLLQGASPTYITRAVVANQGIPVEVFNAGLPQSPPVPHIDLGGQAAQCLTTGRAMSLAQVEHLWHQGLYYGEILVNRPEAYVLLAECVVGGTTTAQALLTGLGVNADGQVNSSHPHCNHRQKIAIVHQGLEAAGFRVPTAKVHPLRLVAAVGDPMQPVVAGMAMAASRRKPVMLAGGTQMLAVYGLIEALAERTGYPWEPGQVVVGTTRWVAEDPTGDTVGLAAQVNAPLIASQLTFKESRWASLRAYEAGFVKEGVGAGGCAIAAWLHQGWRQAELLSHIEALLAQSASLRPSPEDRQTSTSDAYR